MPYKKKWTYAEMARVIPLRHEGNSWIEIARRITSENLAALEGISSSVLAALDGVNRARVRDDFINVLISRMLPLCDGEVSESDLRAAIVLPHRLAWFQERNPLWADLYASYEECLKGIAQYKERRLAEWARDVSEGDTDDK